MSRLTRGIFGRKPTQAGASDITSLDTQYVASVAGVWPSTTSSTEFVAAESFTYVDIGFISYKKLSDGLYYPGLFVDTAPTSSYYSSADANSYFGPVRGLSVAKGGSHVAVIIETRLNPTIYNLFIWKKAAAGYSSPWQYLTVKTSYDQNTTGGIVGPWAVEFHPSGDYLAYGLTATGGMSGQKLFLMSRSGDTFTALSNPTDVAASGYINCMDWNLDGTSLAVGISVSPYIVIYNFSAGTMTKLSNPATLPTGGVNSVKWNHNGSSLAVSHGSGFIVYNRSGNTFTAIAGTPMSSVGGNYAGSISWNNTGTLLATAHFTNGIAVYSRSGDSFSSVSIPAYWNIGDANYATYSGHSQVAFNPNGTELLIGATSMLEIWSVNGTSITRPTTSPIGAFVGRPGGTTSTSGFSSRMGTTFGTGTATVISPTQWLRWVPPA